MASVAWRAAFTAGRRAALTSTAVLLLGAGVMGLSSPPAHADQASFLADVDNEGAFGQLGAPTLLGMGRLACNVAKKGREDATEGLEHGIANDTGVTFADAAQFVNLATRDLCPYPSANPPQANSASATTTAQTNQAFLDTITTSGITGRPDQLINTALTICGHLTAGTSGHDVAAQIHTAEPQRFTLDQANLYVTAAETDYCPANKGR